jgi:hypothetical protein
MSEQLQASGFGVPFGGRITPTGSLAQTAIYMIDALGRLWRASLDGSSPPLWVFTAAPSVAEIRAGFASVAALRSIVPSVASLRTWGYT